MKRTYTSNADFDLGQLAGLEHDTVANQLQPNTTIDNPTLHLGTEQQPGNGIQSGYADGKGTGSLSNLPV